MSTTNQTLKLLPAHRQFLQKVYSQLTIKHHQITGDKEIQIESKLRVRDDILYNIDHNFGEFMQNIQFSILFDRYELNKLDRALLNSLIQNGELYIMDTMIYYFKLE